MSASVRPHRRTPTRFPRPWDSPGKNTAVGCHFLLQCMKVKSESEVARSCLTLSDLMDCSLPGSSVHGIFQARVLEWGAIAFSDVSSICHLFYIQFSVHPEKKLPTSLLHRCHNLHGSFRRLAEHPGECGITTSKVSEHTGAKL